MNGQSKLLLKATVLLFVVYVSMYSFKTMPVLAATSEMEPGVTDYSRLNYNDAVGTLFNNEPVASAGNDQNKAILKGEVQESGDNANIWQQLNTRLIKGICQPTPVIPQPKKVSVSKDMTSVSTSPKYEYLSNTNFIGVEPNKKTDQTMVGLSAKHTDYLAIVPTSVQTGVEFSEDDLPKYNGGIWFKLPAWFAGTWTADSIKVTPTTYNNYISESGVHAFSFNAGVPDMYLAQEETDGIVRDNTGQIWGLFLPSSRK